jgi:hypothetical protein
MHITENKTIMSFGKWASMRTILTEGSKVKTESFKTFFNSTGYSPLCLWMIKIQITVCQLQLLPFILVWLHVLSGTFNCTVQ